MISNPYKESINALVFLKYIHPNIDVETCITINY